MKHTLATSSIRKIAPNLTITDLFTGTDFNFDCVVAKLNGNHPTIINNVSDRAYFIFEGVGKVTVGKTTDAVESNDLVTIKAGTYHTIEGNLKYLIITSPPFKPENEVVIPADSTPF